MISRKRGGTSVLHLHWQVRHPLVRVAAMPLLRYQLESDNVGKLARGD